MQKTLNSIKYIENSEISCNFADMSIKNSKTNGGRKDFMLPYFQFYNSIYSISCEIEVIELFIIYIKTNCFINCMA